jgi:hypothetical protein
MKTGRVLPEDDASARRALQAYVTSLLYLREEAMRDGLQPVADILQRALAAIEAWLDSQESPAETASVLDSSLCQSLDFLLQWLALPSGKRREVIRALSSRESDKPDKKAAKGSAAVSRRTEA